MTKYIKALEIFFEVSSANKPIYQWFTTIFIYFIIIKMVKIE